MLALAAAGIGLLVPGLARAVGTVVVDANISLAPDGGVGDYVLTVFQDAAATDFTSVVFDFDGTNIQLLSGNLDEGSDWYLVGDGDPFSRGRIANGQFTGLWVGLSSSGPVAVGPGSFFLGVSTGTGFGSSGPNRDEFGWIELSISGTELTEVGDAMAYGASGIFVGTAIAIPEPSTALLLSTGLGALASRRVRERPRRLRPRTSR